MIQIQIKVIRIHQCIFQTERCEWPRIQISYIWIRIHHLETQNWTKWFESKSKWFESISVFFKQKVVNGQGFESPTYGFESITWKLKIALSDSNPSTIDSNPTDEKCFLTASFWRIEDSNGHKWYQGYLYSKNLWRTLTHTSREVRATQIKEIQQF